MTLTGAYPMTITGTAAASDAGALAISFTGDDVEDLYRITTGSPEVTLQLSGYTADLDLALYSDDGQTEIRASTGVEGTETIALTDLPPGRYLVGVSFYDSDDPSGQSAYTLRVQAQGNAVAGQEGPGAGGPVLHPVAPNPVRGRAAVEYELAAPAGVRVELYDVLGRRVAVLAQGPRGAGPQAVALEAGALGAGTYVVRLTAGAETRSRRLVVVR